MKQDGFEENKNAKKNRFVAYIKFELKIKKYINNEKDIRSHYHNEIDI